MDSTRQDLPHIVILGAGPAGLGAAYRLARRGGFKVTLIEQNERVGGNAGSFELAGMRLDFGSHRLHPACDPQVLQDIRDLLGEDLLDRPRHGRILLQNRWIHFPLKPADLLLKLQPAFAMGVMRDSIFKALHLRASAAQQSPQPVIASAAQQSLPKDNFASAMEQGLGKTICQDFYFPYARKLWGIDPSEISAAQARRRVSANSLGKMIRKVLSSVPGLKPAGSGRFFYPRQGFGQISEAYRQAAQAAGVDVFLNSPVKGINYQQPGKIVVRFGQEGAEQAIIADHVWSTIPITGLARLLTPSPPDDTLQSAMRINFRAMLLIYLVLEQDRFSEFDAHYFPAAHIRISRLSEPKNYCNTAEPNGRTALCAELPCSPDDPEWSMTDEQLGQLVLRDLAAAGIPVDAPLNQVIVRRLRYAYPIYRSGYENHFERLDEWIGQFDGLLTFGRQGLFAHDNTHHALFMAYRAVDCLGSDGRFDRQRWQEYRRVFETHVVED